MRFFYAKLILPIALSLTCNVAFSQSTRDLLPVEQTHTLTVENIKDTSLAINLDNGKVDYSRTTNDVFTVKPGGVLMAIYNHKHCSCKISIKSDGKVSFHPGSSRHPLCDAGTAHIADNPTLTLKKCS